MKNILLGFLGALLFTGSMLLSGCSVDPCDNVTCVNGQCANGTCICTAGYEGVDCSTAINAKFSGTYNLTEICSISDSASYTVTVVPKAGSQNEVSFTGLWEIFNATVTAQVGANGTNFTIAKQAMGTSGWDIASTAGSITADGSTITITYATYNGTILIETCSATLVK